MSAALARGMSKGGVLTGVGLAAGLLIFPAIAQKGMSGVVSGLRGMSGGGGQKTGVSVCYITVPDNKTADALADKLVSSKLAACVNVIPGIQSTYLWEGKVNRDPELLLMVKTRSELTKTLAEFVQEHHPYDVPEVICSEISDGLPAYLQWVRDSTNADL